MKKTVFLLFTILILSNCRTLGSWNKMNPYPQKELTISKNITFQANRILYDEMVYDVCIINPQKITLKITKSLNESGLSFSKLNKDLKNKDEILIFATNGGMYEKDRTPLGYYAEENKIYHDLNRTDGYGNFYMKPNGVFFLQDQNPQILETEDFFQNIIEKGIIPRIATQSGPLLIQNGKIHQSFQKDSDNKFIRNGVALIEWETTELIVFVISDRPVNFYDFSKFLKDFFHCSSALYLDGHISAMYVPSLQRNQMGGSFGTMLYCTEP